MQEVKTSYREYVMEGLRSVPVEVRTHTRRRCPTQIQERRQPCREEPVSSPRAHGYTVGCPGYEQLQLKLEIRRNPMIPAGAGWNRTSPTRPQDRRGSTEPRIDWTRGLLSWYNQMLRNRSGLSRKFAWRSNAKEASKESVMPLKLFD